MAPTSSGSRDVRRAQASGRKPDRVSGQGVPAQLGKGKNNILECAAVGAAQCVPRNIFVESNNVLPWATFVARIAAPSGGEHFMQSRVLINTPAEQLRRLRRLPIPIAAVIKRHRFNMADSLKDRGVRGAQMPRARARHSGLFLRSAQNLGQRARADPAGVEQLRQHGFATFGGRGHRPAGRPSGRQSQHHCEACASASHTTRKAKA